MLRPAPNEPAAQIDVDELQEWFESLDDVRLRYSAEEAGALLTALRHRAQERGVPIPFTANTPYVNTIPVERQPRYPGNREYERRIKSVIRWNAMAMVSRANHKHSGLGGHISTYASAATLLEVGFNHFFHARDENHPGDLVYYQGHASPGVYGRAYLEGRLSDQQLENFRQELAPGGGLSSYPHPWLMPGFWQFPTVSMGLGPLMAIYQARFERYLAHRGLAETSPAHVWCFIGDGEVDEPETLGAIALASREGLDNLIFVVNCNLQRLDGPVRGNGKIIQELETVFRGAGWNTIKVIWGSEWDALFAADEEGALVKRMEEVVDGHYQRYKAEDGAYVRKHFFSTPELKKLVEHLTDEQIGRLRRGGHDPEKVYAAYKAAVENVGSPTVILAKTIKGYGLGETGEGRNISHQAKKLNDDELREFRSRFGVPISDEDIHEHPFFKPAADTPHMKYLHERRRSLGGFVPERKVLAPPLEIPPLDAFERTTKGGGGRDQATTQVFVQFLSSLLRDKTLGKLIVPIVPDEARTFGMEGLFRQCGIYSSKGQLYEPVDAETVLFYKEIKEGQLLEEGINEAGGMSSFIAAGTAYANRGLNTIPFFIYYSMFGFQRIGDLIWAAADMCCRGFLLGATAGRTTLAGEGLQHQDGHSHLLAATVPNVVAYDPAYGYELATIIRAGLKRMYAQQERIFYYITLYNEPYAMPAMPEGVEDGILKGMYQLKSAEPAKPRTDARPQLFGSGPILREALRAQQLLADEFGIASDVWSVTSYKELRREALAVERWNRLHPGERPRESYVETVLKGRSGPFVAVSDYMRLVGEQIARWVPGDFVALGTDGFGRSETREALRRHFEVDAEHIAQATIGSLSRQGKVDASFAKAVIGRLKIDPESVDPASA